MSGKNVFCRLLVIIFINSSISKISITNFNKDIETKSGTSIEFRDNCEIQSFSIDSCKLDVLNINSTSIEVCKMQNAKLQEINIRKCDLISNLILTGVIIDHCLKIEDTTIFVYKSNECKIEVIKLMYSIISEVELNKLKTFDLNIDTTHINSKINIDYLDENTFVGINRSEVKNLSISNSNITQLNISRSSISYYIGISGKTKVDLITIQFCYFKSCYISDVKNSYLNITKSLIEKLGFYSFINERFEFLNNTLINFIFSVSTFNNFLINNSIILELRFDQSQFTYFSLLNTNINKLNCKSLSSKESHFNFSNVNLLNFSECVLNSETSIYFNQCSIKTLDFSNLSNNGKICFRNLKLLQNAFELNLIDYIKPELYNNQEETINTLEEIKKNVDAGLKSVKNNYEKEKDQKPTYIQFFQTSLGLTEFIGSDLDSYRIKYYNSNITNCAITNNDSVLENIEIIDSEKKVSNNNEFIFSQLVSFYNQFKKIFQNQGNQHLYLKYHILWSNSRFELIKKQSKRKNLAEYISLLLNKHSNYFGSNWLRAVCFILIVSVPFYLLYLWSADRIYFGGEFDVDLIGYYFNFLLPTRGLNFLNNPFVTGLMLTIDFFSRIFIGYGIYQLIAAFRLYGKK